MKAQLKQEINDLQDLKRSLKGDVFTVQQRKDISEKIYYLKRRLNEYK
jgi:hypothetical protein